MTTFLLNHGEGLRWVRRQLFEEEPNPAQEVRRRLAGTERFV
jgi:hypothetical protein